MATLTATSNGDGTINLAFSGTVAGAVTITGSNTTTGATFSIPYSAATSTTDFSPRNATNNGYVFYYKDSGGTAIATVTASMFPTWAVGSVTASTSGGSSGCSWNIPADNNTATTFVGVTLFYSINGGAQVQYGATDGYSNIGSIPSTALFVGYSSTVQWTVTMHYFDTRYGDFTYPSSSSTVTTGPPPPAAPNPPSDLTAVDNGSSVDLAWTASPGGASGYEISRAGSVIATQTGVTKTDSSPGATRPLTYSVRAYNSNASGTSYSAAVSVTVGATDSVGVLIA